MDLQECHDLLTLAKVGKVKVVLVIVERYGKMYIHGILYMAQCIYAYIYMHGFTGYTLRIHKYTHILTQTGLSTHKQVMHFYNSTVCAVYTVIACGLRRLGGGCSNSIMIWMPSLFFWHSHCSKHPDRRICVGQMSSVF